MRTVLGIPLGWRLALIVLLAALAAFGAGFAWFVHAASQPAALPDKADGIVVLTGGPERIETGFLLLAAGHAPALLVSGLGSALDAAELARRAALDPAALAGRVTLGRAATSTHTNAAETAAWARREKIHSLIVVTAGYHMPRALAELRPALPGVTLYPAPVFAGMRRGPGQVKAPQIKAPSWRLLAEEYVKWLAVELGLSALAPPLERAHEPSGAGQPGTSGQKE
jgi:uncharacterized SAM-binding protein YcdF (DUF218 family)